MTAEWTRQDIGHEEGAAMLLGDRVRELRKEHGWSQGELGERIGTDAGRISRYEGGRITPSLEALVRLADALGVTADYLVREDAPRQNLDGHDLGSLGSRLAAVAELSDEDRSLVASFVDALVTKSRLKALVGDIA